MNLQKNRNLKDLSIYILYAIILLFHSCRRLETDDLLKGGASIVNIKMQRALFSNDNQSIKEYLAENQGSFTISNSTQSYKKSVNSNVVLIADLASGNTNSLSIIEGDKLESGIKYRLIIYDKKNGTYIKHQDYTIGSKLDFIVLNSGNEYDIIAYSYNSNTLPEIREEEKLNLSNAWAGYDNSNRDFMYLKLSFIPKKGDNVLNIALRHKLSQLTVSVNVSDLTKAYVGNITNIENALVRPHYTKGKFNLSSGSISELEGLAEIPLVFSGLPNTMVSTKVLINPGLKTTENNGNFTAAITTEKLGTQQVNLLNRFKISPETKNDLKISLVKPEIDLPDIQLTGSNAAPSQYIRYYFSDDAILKMNKIKVAKSSYAGYYAVMNYYGGYIGLQQTDDPKYSSQFILIASLWDKDTAKGSLAGYSYLGTNTKTERFGGEGDGQKTTNSYGWKLNNWYNFVLRSWLEGGKIYVANFVQDLSTEKWFLISILYREETQYYLWTKTPSFIENWSGGYPDRDGRFVRKVYQKDCWNLDINNKWQKPTSVEFSVNDTDADRSRNGYFDRSFNSGYDLSEKAYFSVHGGSTLPSLDFGSGRTLNLPLQADQGDTPVINQLELISSNATYANNVLTVSWGISDTRAPQLSYKIELLNSNGDIIETVQRTKPEQREEAITRQLASGSYTIRLTLTDIFNKEVAARVININI